MPCFYGRRQGELVEITGPDARHLARSLRARPGERVSVVEPEGRLLQVRLTSVDDLRVTGQVESEVEHRPEPSRSITLAVAALPASALDLVLSRGTEVGAAEFVLVAAERCVARARPGRADRWATICREAAMLACRLVVPRVRGPLPFRQAWEEASSPYLLDRGGTPMRALEDGATLFVGPEGGWAPDELDRARGRVLSLGPRNLRSETAALVGLALALGSG
ncbi:MAG TPA: RsmE family RNA methyltransferase [Candidatus Dormibacteraeota bacterium]|nr:RsmE family RNA methyltransferase [Candidatus Dormibacteraeota bacterium]